MENPLKNETEHWKDVDGLCIPQCGVCRDNLKAGLDPDGGPRTPGRAYLIRTHDGFWWRPNGSGYTPNLAEAGIYSEQSSMYLLGASYADRRECVVVARPHLERANRMLRDRIEALALVEAGQDKA